MKKYVLLSGLCNETGFFETSASALKKAIDNEEEILFIASRKSDYAGNDDKVMRICNFFATIGIGFKDVKLLDGRMALCEQKELIKNAVNIFLMGGDTLSQMSELKKNGLVDLLRAHKNPIIGISAGAINMAKRSVLPLTPIRKQSYSYPGIGLVDISVTPHFDVTREEYLKNETLPMTYAGAIYGMEENGAILIEGDQVEFYGTIYKLHNGAIQLINE